MAQCLDFQIEPGVYLVWQQRFAVGMARPCLTTFYCSASTAALLLLLLSQPSMKNLSACPCVTLAITRAGIILFKVDFIILSLKRVF